MDFFMVLGFVFILLLILTPVANEYRPEDDWDFTGTWEDTDE